VTLLISVQHHNDNQSCCF